MSGDLGTMEGDRKKPSQGISKMEREKIIAELSQAGDQDVLSGKLIDANEDLGIRICGVLFDDLDHLLIDVFYEKDEMEIHMSFDETGVHLSVPDLEDSLYSPCLLTYETFTLAEITALLDVSRSGTERETL